MSENITLTILKEALLLEKRGKAFYTKVAEQAKNSKVKELFNLMATEEENHIQILSQQFKSFRAEGTLKWELKDDTVQSKIVNSVINTEIKKEINAADYEAAAISAAMSMEKNAIALYSERAEECDNENEKALYSWLTKWETSHLDFLVKLDRELCEEIWYDNQFWPF